MNSEQFSIAGSFPTLHTNQASSNSRSGLSTRTWRLAAFLQIRMPVLMSLFFIILSASTAEAQTSLFDPKFDELRKASEEWDRRLGPERKVINLVCLVPDVTTFLEAIKVWDREHCFPILIDDVEFSFKFLRAFRPARVTVDV